MRDWLHQPGQWLGGFDFPFGLPRELVQHLGWPLQWEACIAHYAALSRPDIQKTFAAFCDARPAGQKFAHRATDRLAGSSPSMKWVNPPVAYMLHAGVPLLVEAGIHIPGLYAGDGSPFDAAGRPHRIALEAYPGLLAREILGHRSYKSDEQGRTRLKLRLQQSHALRDTLVDDASGDSLDAVLCLIQAAWAQRQGAPCYGLPAQMDPLEGWIVTA
jgi:hypothetical protein